MAATPEILHLVPPAHDRWVAPGGWRRGLLGVAIGTLAGVVLVVADHADRRARRARRRRAGNDRQ